MFEPGLHIKLPWPIDQVYRYETRKIQSFNVGFVPGEDESHEKAVLWTGKHSKEESNWLIASRKDRASEMASARPGQPGEQGIPADLINVSVPVQFQIKDLKAWAYSHTDAANLLERVATREVVLYLAGIDLFELMSSGLAEAARDLRSRIQDHADRLKLGVNIVLVGLQDLHPPVKVAPKFEEVVGALQENQARLHEAEGYAGRTVTLAKGKPNAGSMSPIPTATGQSWRQLPKQASLQIKWPLTRLPPRFTWERSLHFLALSVGLPIPHKYVLATTNTEDLLQFNLEDKIRGDLINDLTIPSSKK